MRWQIVVVLLAACSAGENTDCEVAFAPGVHTVLSARWTSPQPGRSWVEYDLDGEVQSTPAREDGGTDHVADLLGLRPLTDVAWTLITERGGRRWTCSGASATENLEPQTVGLDVLTYDEDLVDPMRFLLGTAYGFNKPSSVFVADRETGQTRWYLEGQEGAQLTTARLQADDGASSLAFGVVYNTADADRVEDIGAVVKVTATGEQTDAVRTPWAHHVFTVLPDGTVAWLALDARAWYDPDTGTTRMVAGDSLHELAPDGTDTEIFSVWDWAAVEPSTLWNLNFYPGYLDWTHADGIRWDDERQVYAVTFAGIEQVWLISRGGVPQKRFGNNAEYTPAPGATWAHPHDGSLLPDGELLVYLGSPETRRSGCHQFRVDEATHLLTETWGYDTDFGGFALGKCRRMPNGNTLIGYGNAGAIQEVTPDRIVAWDARVNQTAGLGTTHPFDALYPEP